jgi:hypothetical protein
VHLDRFPRGPSPGESDGGRGDHQKTVPEVNARTVSHGQLLRGAAVLIE